MREPCIRAMGLRALVLGFSLVSSTQAWATCDAGTVDPDLATGTIAVSYVTKDADGNPVPHSVTVTRPTHFTPTIVVTTTFNPGTKLYTYQYTVSNASTSSQQIDTVEFGLPARVRVEGFVGPSSPGWSFFPDADPEGGFSWAFLPGPRSDMKIEGIAQGASASP